LERLREEAVSHWQREAQDVEARIRMLRRQADDLKIQLEQLESTGADGVCPTCKRSLGAEYDRVVSVVRGQYEEVVQDGKWHRKREEQLASEPSAVIEAKGQLARAREERDRMKTQLAGAEAALSQAIALRSELETEEARARTLAGEIAAHPEGYDAERHAKVRDELERLRELERNATQLETRLERQAQLKSARAEAEEEEKQIRAQVSDLEAKRAELGFSEPRYREVGEKYEAARSLLDAARLEVERARGEADSARQAADAARREAFGDLRHELNERVRPELSEIASVFLAELTDGRYNQIEISQDYDVVVLDQGEEKPVISGGEEDLANLVLRLAISQMIADRAGQTLSLLIFDEVFGGLDEARRESVVHLLQRLQDHFEQVILITHIESIREGMDQVVRVGYDETTGASAVSDESPSAGGEELRVEDLAALISE
jgi:exonuclease SbcC